MNQTKLYYQIVEMKIKEQQNNLACSFTSFKVLIIKSNELIFWSFFSVYNLWIKVAAYLDTAEIKKFEINCVSILLIIFAIICACWSLSAEQ